MIFRYLLSIVLILNINVALGSKLLLGSSGNFHKSYGPVVKAKSTLQRQDKTAWHQSRENLMESICLVVNQKTKSVQPDNKSLLINQLLQKIRKELYLDKVKMFDVLGKSKRKSFDFLARNKTLIKGFFGELNANNLMLYSGYDVLPCRLDFNQGIDHVFIKYARNVVIENIVIMESKYICSGGRIKLSKSSDGVQQLSNAWLNRQIGILRTSKLHQKTLKILEENKDKIQLHGYFIFADGKRVWRDYGRFDYNHPTDKAAKCVASCCPFSLSIESVDQRIMICPWKTVQKTTRMKNRKG